MKKNYLLFIFAVVGFFAVGLILFFNLDVFAIEQIKTSEFFVFSSESQISAATSTPFTIYIGDNLSGISNPVKSVYFTISGVYTGNGTLELKIDNDSATAKTFTLPSVSAPTTFEILYKDDSNKINPTSAGSYDYTLYLTPTSITVSGLSAKVNVTHRFVPPSCPDGQPSNEKIKTSEFFVFSSESQISAATSTPFTIYIGDNLSGISNPVKSVYFTISGVYTGNGTLELKIDNDSATAKTFTLPSVSAPTTFEILYKDDSNKINPTSAGSYDYTLYLTPTSITVSGLSAKVNVTHRYKPSGSCGGGYFPSAEIISPIFDTGAANGVEYNWLMASGTTPVGTKIRVQLATAATSTGPWTYLGSNCDISSYYYDSTLPSSPTPQEIKCFSEHNNKRYFRYKAILCSSSDCSAAGVATPQIEKIIVNWSP